MFLFFRGGWFVYISLDSQYDWQQQEDRINIGTELYCSSYNLFHCINKYLYGMTKIRYCMLFRQIQTLHLLLITVDYLLCILSRLPICIVWYISNFTRIICSFKSVTRRNHTIFRFSSFFYPPFQNIMTQLIAMVILLTTFSSSVIFVVANLKKNCYAYLNN